MVGYQVTWSSMYRWKYRLERERNGRFVKLRRRCFFGAILEKSLKMKLYTDLNIYRLQITNGIHLSFAILDSSGDDGATAD